MFCPKCGQWNAGSATQCMACGASLLPPGLGNAQAIPTAAPTVPAVPPQPTLPPMPPQQQAQPPSYSPEPASSYHSAPPAYPNYPPPSSSGYPQPSSSGYPQPSSPGYPQPSSSGYPQPSSSGYPQPSSSGYPQPSSPGYPQPQPFPGAPSAYPSAMPPAYPTYSPLPPGSVYGAQAPPAYGAGYPAQMQRALNQCRVCGSMLAYGMLACSICTVPLGMIANPHDPTVTTYLLAQALNQPGTSPVYAAPGAYAGRAANAQNDVPDEAKKGWNWAAALNSTLWAFTHRSVGWGLLCGAGLFLWVMLILGTASTSSADMRSTADGPSDVVIAGVLIGAMALFWVIKTLYLGSNGNAIAWRSGRYANLSQMKNIQRQWNTWSIVVFFVASAVLLTATAIAAKH